MKTVKVVWDDAGSFTQEDTTWHTFDSLLEAYGLANFVQNSVGYLLYENAKDLIITQSLDDRLVEGNVNLYANALRIPKCNIIEIIELKEELVK